MWRSTPTNITVSCCDETMPLRIPIPLPAMRNADSQRCRRRRGHLVFAGDARTEHWHLPLEVTEPGWCGGDRRASLSTSTMPMERLPTATWWLVVSTWDFALLDPHPVSFESGRRRWSSGSDRLVGDELAGDDGEQLHDAVSKATVWSAHSSIVDHRGLRWYAHRRRGVRVDGAGDDAVGAAPSVGPREVEATSSSHRLRNSIAEWGGGPRGQRCAALGGRLQTWPRAVDARRVQVDDDVARHSPEEEVYEP